MCPRWARRRQIPIRRAVRAARGTAVHLPHQGSFLLRTWEPRSERPAREAGQADRSGDVSDEGRSLRSSPSAGKPRTWRREAVMGTASRPPGKAMYVAPRPDWDWLRIVQRKLYARSEHSLRVTSWRAGCITKGACPVRKGALGNLPARAGKAPGAHLTRRAGPTHTPSSGPSRNPPRALRSQGSPATPTRHIAAARGRRRAPGLGRETSRGSRARPGGAESLPAASAHTAVA